MEDNRIFHAATSGDVQVLEHDLLQQITCDAHYRQVIFRLNDDGYTALHLAAANGHKEVVQFLLEFGRQHHDLISVEEMCTKKGKNGANPLHLAAISGEVDVINLILDVCWSAAFGVTDFYETILHLAVKHNRYIAFEVLVRRLRSETNLINYPDSQDNTVLHLVTAKREFRMIQDLVRQPGIELNNKNSYGLTPLDMIFMCAINSNDLYIAKEIQSAGGQISTSQTAITNSPPIQANVVEEAEQPIKDMVSGILIMASLIATVTFQVALAPPGGFTQHQSPSRPGERYINPGKAVLYYLARDKYTTLMIMNANAFMASVLVIISLIQPSKFLHLVWPKVRFFLNFIVVVVTIEFFLILSIANEGKLLRVPGFLTTIVGWGVLLGLTVISLLFQTSRRYYMPFFTCGCCGKHLGF